VEYQDGPELIKENCVLLKSDFKTNLQFGLQPITNSVTSRELVKLYLDDVRPKLKQNPTDPLFIGITGKELRVGRLVTSFFKRVLNLNIHTTRIRSIIATECATLLARGEISNEANESMNCISGHSGITAKKSYIKRSRIDDIQSAKFVHKKMLRETALEDVLADEQHHEHEQHLRYRHFIILSMLVFADITAFQYFLFNMRANDIL